MTDTKLCEGCGKLFPRGKWDLGERWVERRVCCRSCGGKIAKQSRAQNKGNSPIVIHSKRCGSCGQQYEATQSHACRVRIPRLPWEVYA